MSRVMLCFIGTWLGVAVSVVLYHRLVIEPALRVGIIDLAEVYRAQEAAFTRQVGQARTDTEREQALEQVKVFAQRLPQALEELPRECQCVVAVKGALSPPPDRVVELTDALRRKVSAP